MAGLDRDVLNLIGYIAENKIQKAKEAAYICCEKDITKKNEKIICKYKDMLKEKQAFQIPASLSGIINITDPESFIPERYYLSEERKKFLNEIMINRNVSEKMKEMKINYNNSSLIYGVSGTGKTEFAKYAAYKLGLPYIYINFSYVIDSYMGATCRNIKKIFDFCKTTPCMLMIDEIDCIGVKRGHNSGADGELGRTTIGLLQMLDEMTGDQVIIAATNRYDRLDPALQRRFHRAVEFLPYGDPDNMRMIEQYVKDIGMEKIIDDIKAGDMRSLTQAEIITDLNNRIAKYIVNE